MLESFAKIRLPRMAEAFFCSCVCGICSDVGENEDLSAHDDRGLILFDQVRVLGSGNGF